jgi:hypothetical protein
MIKLAIIFYGLSILSLITGIFLVYQPVPLMISILTAALFVMASAACLAWEYHFN